MVRIPEDDLGHIHYGGGAYRTLRYPSPHQSICDVMIPRFNATLFYKGKSIPVIAGIDTGASHLMVVVSPATADKLGLPRKKANPVGVVGGGTAISYDSELDRVVLDNVQNCMINNPQTIIASPAAGEDILIGEDYLKALDVTINYTSGQARLSCRGGAAGAALPEWWETPDFRVVAAGIGLLFIVGFLVSLSKE